MNKQQNQRTLSPIMFGPSFMSQVRECNLSAVKMNLRETLAFPDNRDRPPEIPNIDYPSMITGDPIAKIDSRWFGKPVAIIGAGAAGLCAAYELMRSGLVPVMYEMQWNREIV